MRIRWLRGTVHPRAKGQIEDCTKTGVTPDIVAVWVRKGFCEIVREEPPKVEEKKVKDRPKVRTRAIGKAPTKDE